MTASQTHASFTKFVSCWNEGTLSLSYYNGGEEFDKCCEEVKHYSEGSKWNFKVTPREQGMLTDIKGGRGGEGERIGNQRKQSAAGRNRVMVKPRVEGEVCKVVGGGGGGRGGPSDAQKAVLAKLGMSELAKGGKVQIKPR